MNTSTLSRIVGGIICAGTLLTSGLVTSQTSNGDPPDNDIGGNDSPEGVSSGFNGMVNTACAYDPYTGNAQRVIQDIVVPGAAGAYGLGWTRFYNSRDPDVTTPMGVGWRHSYLWSEDYLGGDIVHFPDGRVVDFNEATGISERLPAVGHLLLGDGGQVIFEAVPYTINGQQYARYRVKRIIDPYGLATVMDYESLGADDNGNETYRLLKITEPAGRYLKLGYFNGNLIGRVEAYDTQNNLTQSVDYAYTISNHQPGGPYWILTTATYNDGTSAQYTYQADNSSKRSAPGIPLLKTADDSRYHGPMHQIDYLFVAGDRIRGKIKSERKPGSNQAVSTLTFPANRVQNRVETRGDGYKRTFTYSGTGRVLSHTDFNNTYPASRLSYDTNNFLRSTKDALDHEIVYTHEPNIGQVTQVLRADGVSHVDLGYSDPNNPYYLTSRTDERNNATYFDRDGKNRVWQIRHPDGGIERFWYNEAFGKVQTHQRTNGAYEHFLYDSAGRLRTAWNPTATASWPPSSNEPHVSFDYYSTGHPWADRIYHVTDQRFNITEVEYDVNAAGQPVAGRGLVTKITHLADNSYVSFGYDAQGNLSWREDELRNRTSFGYDDYNRVVTMAPPGPAGPATFTYERAGAADPYLHTERAVHIGTDGAGVTVERIYDPNFRVKSIAQIDGTTTPPTTRYDYWNNGLLKTVHDPRNFNWTMSYTYTARNQVETVVDALQHRTVYHYDPAGNVDYADRPDSKRVTRSYDVMNRLQTLVEPLNASANKTTTFTYWSSGRVQTVEDNNHQITRFTYDYSDRQQYMFYPDNTFQQWDYNEVGVLQGYRTVGGKIQRFGADNRNRITATWWDPGDPTDHAYFEYDAASRMTRAWNDNSDIHRTYDTAGRLLAEEQRLPEPVGAKTVTYSRDPAGKKTALGLVGTPYQFAYHYDPIGRLDQILNVDNTAQGTSQSLWYQYSYDPASNVTQRYCPMNGVAQIYSRDELGRIDTLTVQKATEPQYGAVEPPPIAVAGSDPVVPVPTLPRPLSILVGLTNLTSSVGQTVPTVGTVLSSEQYVYDDNMPWLRAAQRTIGETSGQNDGFAYDYSGQLESASYSMWSGQATRSVNYSQDAMGNRSQVNDNGNVQGYSTNPNYRNQYVTAPAGSVNNGVEHEIAGYAGLSYTYRADQKLATVTGNGNSYTLAYDALGRCVKRTLNGNTIYYTYDGPNPIYEWKADGTRAGMNLYGQGNDEILLRGDYVVVPQGQGYFFQQNAQGSVTYLTGFSGEVIEKYRYDAFGTPTTLGPIRGSFNNRFKFTGREYQEAFGIYEYRNRAYHPGLGRFLSEDPLGFAAGDTNLSRYCGGDPVNFTDPSGLIDHNVGRHTFILIKPLEAMTRSFDPTTAFFRGAMDWGPFEQVMQYLGGGDHGRTGSSFSGFAGQGDPGGGGGQSALQRITDLVIGANSGAAWRAAVTEPWVEGPTGGFLPQSLAKGLLNVRGMIPANAAANGFHAWHAGSNAYLAQQLGLVGQPLIVLGGIFHETPLDWNSFKDEQRTQGTVNHVLDSATDIIANFVGMPMGYAQPGPAGIQAAIYYGNQVPGPTDHGKDYSYQGDPSEAWGPYQ